MTEKEKIRYLIKCANSETIALAVWRKPEEKCEKITLGDVAAIINRQQAENKELKTENLMLSQKRFNIFERIEFTDKLKKQTKAEAIKECLEKIEQRDVSESDFYIMVKKAEFDNLLKELAGEDK